MYSCMFLVFFFFKQKTAYEMRISDWSSDVCSSDLEALDRCVAIAVALMRHIATSGCLARAAVAEGDFADYSGCWPKEIRQEIANLQSDDTVSLGKIGRASCRERVCQYV